MDYLSKNISNFSFIFEANPQICFQMRKTGKLGLMRSILRKLLVFIKDERDQYQVAGCNRILEELEVAYNQSEKEWKSLNDLSKKHGKEEQNYQFTRKFNCMIPNHGFSINTVNRLLLCYGRNNYSKSVPIAMFIQ